MLLRKLYRRHDSTRAELIHLENSIEYAGLILLDIILRIFHFDDINVESSYV